MGESEIYIYIKKRIKAKMQRKKERDRETKSHLCVAMATSRGVCLCVCVWLSRQRASTHLEVSVHNIMLVDMIDTLQDLTNAMTTEREKGTNGEKDVSVTALHYNHMYST